MQEQEIIKETELIKKCQGGDTAAFEPLIDIYKNNLFAYLCRISGSTESAKDLFQETLIKVWKGIKNYKEQKKFSSWLFAVAHNTALDEIRKSKNRVKTIYTENTFNYSGNTNPFNEYAAAETERIIYRELNKLPDKQKQVFLLRQHGGITFKEISEILDEPLNTVLSHMHYAVKKLQTVLRKENAK